MMLAEMSGDLIEKTAVKVEELPASLTLHVVMQRFFSGRLRILVTGARTINRRVLYEESLFLKPLKMPVYRSLSDRVTFMNESKVNAVGSYVPAAVPLYHSQNKFALVCIVSDLGHINHTILKLGISFILI